METRETKRVKVLARSGDRGYRREKGGEGEEQQDSAHAHLVVAVDVGCDRWCDYGRIVQEHEHAGGRVFFSS